MPKNTRKQKFPWFLLIPAALLLAGAVFAVVFLKTNTKIANTWQKNSVETLSLPEFSDTDIQSLNAFPNLKYLDLKSLTLTADEARHFNDVLPENLTAEFYIPIGDSRFLNTETELDIHGFSEGEESLFSLFRNLKKLHFEVSSLKPCVTELATKLPGCDVSWDVDINGTVTNSTVTSLDLSGETIKDFPAFLNSLNYLPCLKTIVLENTNLTKEDLSEIAAAFPELSLQSSVFIGETGYPANTETLDLSGCGLSSGELINALSGFTELKMVSLRNCSYSEKEMKQIYNACPDVVFEWQLPVYGRMFESTVESMDFSNMPVTDGFAELKEKLPFFRNLKTVDVSFCGLSDEECDALNKAFPSVDIVWTVTVFGNRKFLVRTDATSFSTALSANSPYHISKKGSKCLKYCTKMEALDIGHNNIHEIEFVENMPNLRILIVAGCGVKDISCLKNLEHLEYLELFANDITDLSPLSGKDTILDLNIAKNKIKDLTPLYSCKNLDRIWASYNPLEDGQEEAIREHFPNATFNFTVYSPTQGGWRKHERFYEMRAFFGLPVID